MSLLGEAPGGVPERLTGRRQTGSAAMRLHGKVSVITGAGSGIGRAAALVFAREGAKVVAADVRRETAEETTRMIRAGGGPALAVHVDVSDAQSVRRVFQEGMAG